MSRKTQKVRTTFRPRKPIEVTEQEARDLRRQGLLVEDQKPGSGEPAKAATKKTADEPSK